MFATKEADRLKFAVNGTDPNSLVGDPQFVDVAHGDFRVKDNSPALRIGFKNFPMDEFGVVSDWLKQLVKQPEIPDVIQQKVLEGKTFQWHGATVKNIGTEADKSAVGLSGKGGILILALPENSKMSVLRVGDVILNYNGKKLSGFDSLNKMEKEKKPNELVELIIQRNQTQKTVTLDLK